MKLIDVIILGLAIVFLVIGIDQIIVLGFSDAYWALMIALILFFYYNLRKARQNDPPEKTTEAKRRKKNNR